MGKVEELLIWPFCSCKAPGTITGVKGGELSLKGMAGCGKKSRNRREGRCQNGTIRRGSVLHLCLGKGLFITYIGVPNETINKWKLGFTCIPHTKLWRKSKEICYFFRSEKSKLKHWQSHYLFFLWQTSKRFVDILNL